MMSHHFLTTKMIGYKDDESPFFDNENDRI